MIVRRTGCHSFRGDLMLIRTPSSDTLQYSDVTPKQAYLNRRRFFATSAGAAATLLLTDRSTAAPLQNVNKAPPLHNLLNDTPPAKNILTSYNNFYEFGTGKEEPAKNAPSW